MDSVPVDDRGIVIERVVENARRMMKEHGGPENIAALVMIQAGYAPGQFGFDAAGEPNRVMMAALTFLIMNLSRSPLFISRFADMPLREIALDLAAEIDAERGP